MKLPIDSDRAGASAAEGEPAEGEGLARRGEEVAVQRFLTPKEAGLILNVSAAVVRRMFQEGTLQGVRCGPKLVRICLTSVANYREAPKPRHKRIVKDWIGTR